MPDKIKVFSREGAKVPREENYRKYYPQKLEDAAEVPLTPYIERLLLDGDLVNAGKVVAASKKKGG